MKEQAREGKEEEEEWAGRTDKKKERRTGSTQLPRISTAKNWIEFKG